MKESSRDRPLHGDSFKGLGFSSTPPPTAFTLEAKRRASQKPLFWKIPLRGLKMRGGGEQKRSGVLEPVTGCGNSHLCLMTRPEALHPSSVRMDKWVIWWETDVAALALRAAVTVNHILPSLLHQAQNPDYR